MKTIREIRTEAGLTQRELAYKYEIPLQTIKQWESSPSSSSHRTPPDYVISLLEKNELEKKEEGSSGGRGKVEFLIEAARESKFDSALWLRYLSKEFADGECLLSEGQVDGVIESGQLTMYQRISLQRAVTPGTATNNLVAGANMPARATMLDALRGRQMNDR